MSNFKGSTGPRVGNVSEVVAVIDLFPFKKSLSRNFLYNNLNNLIIM